MGVKTDVEIQADIVAAYSGGSDRVQWLTELRPILEDIKDSKINVGQKGVANGVASLNGSGLVPSAQLPSYVDDVVEAANFAALPGTGETGKIYVTLDDNKQFRWSGSAYVEITDGSSAWGTIAGDLEDQTDLQAALDAKSNTGHTHVATAITEDSTHRFATDAEKTAWNAKQAALVSATNIKTVVGNDLLGSGNVTTDQLLPSQTGANGKVLQSNGTTATWETPTGGGAADSIQNHTSGATVAVTNGVNVLYINPAATLAALEITLPATPHASNEIEIYFGGTVGSGDVVTAIDILPNTGQTLLQATTPSNVAAGESIAYKYNSSLSKWYRK